MSLVKQIDDKGAVLEWSPIATNSNMVVLGTKVVTPTPNFVCNSFKLAS